MFKQKFNKNYKLIKTKTNKNNKNNRIMFKLKNN